PSRVTTSRWPSLTAPRSMTASSSHWAAMASKTFGCSPTALIASCPTAPASTCGKPVPAAAPPEKRREQMKSHFRALAIAGSMILAATGLSALSGAVDAQAAGPLIKPTDHFPNGETPETFQGPVGRADCGPGSNPETSDLQGSVTVADRESGRSSQGYRCNMALVGNYGTHSPLPFEGAEWQLARYKDSSGHQCAYYSQRMVNPVSEGVTQQRPGTVVVDVTNPADPKFSENLATPGMYDPWETLKVSEQRGLLAAVQVGDGEAGSYMG